MGVGVQCIVLKAELRIFTVPNPVYANINQIRWGNKVVNDPTSHLARNNSIFYIHVGVFTKVFFLKHLLNNTKSFSTITER